MMRRATAIPALLLPLSLALAGCPSECEQLSDIICDCEPTRFERESCRAEVQTQQQSQPAPTEEQRATCQGAIDTCTCEALQQNRTDLCGFTRDQGVTGEVTE